MVLVSRALCGPVARDIRHPSPRLGHAPWELVARGDPTASELTVTVIPPRPDVARLRQRQDVGVTIVIHIDGEEAHNRGVMAERDASVPAPREDYLNVRLVSREAVKHTVVVEIPNKGHRTVGKRTSGS